MSIRKHLIVTGTVSVNELSAITSQYSAQVANNIMLQVRSHLDKEFGHLRVHRHREIFVEGHHCQTYLVAGLLRVQYYSKQIALCINRSQDELGDRSGVPISWGVGESMMEAENERLDRLHD